MAPGHCWVQKPAHFWSFPKGPALLYADDLPRFSFVFSSTHQLDPGELAQGIASSGILFSSVKLLQLFSCEQWLIVLSNNCNNSQHFHTAIHPQRVSPTLTNEFSGFLLRHRTASCDHADHLGNYNFLCIEDYSKNYFCYFRCSLANVNLIR